MTTRSIDSFNAYRQLHVGDATMGYFALDGIAGGAQLPICLRILLENLMRNEDGRVVTADEIEMLSSWRPDAHPVSDLMFRPGRVIMNDFTGVAALADLASMREAFIGLGGDGSTVNPLVPIELVIDHSVIVDSFGGSESFDVNLARDYGRNSERYGFLRWSQNAFDNLAVVPPGVGILHQVNLERLAPVVVVANGVAHPDTLIGTDSHTTMINSLGVLGWGVGGIEALAAMLGQAVSIVIPRVLGVRLTGDMAEGTTSSDLVLTLTQQIRRHGAVGTFVEFFGEGLARVPVEARATISNMSPEFGSTCALFPIDDDTLRYLRVTGRAENQLQLVETYAKANGLWHDPRNEPTYSETLEFDLSQVEPSIAGPARPNDRVPLRDARQHFRTALTSSLGARQPGPPSGGLVGADPGWSLADGAVVIASITSCTNTSNPIVMIMSGLIAKNAVELGLQRKPWVKTSFAPGSRVVTEYLDQANLTTYLDKLGFNLVGYGCTTCIGNSGPLPDDVSSAIRAANIAAASVLSGNRNFEGRIHPDVAMNFLMSPPLVVAYALAGTMDIDLTTEPLGWAADGAPILLRDIWPSQADVSAVLSRALTSSMFADSYRDFLVGDLDWRRLPAAASATYNWQPDSTYLRPATYFEGMRRLPAAVADIVDARVLVMVGDAISTDLISPAGQIGFDSPAAHYLEEHGVARAEFNSYGSRRGNHEVMTRGTFAAGKLRNFLTPEQRGGVTRDFSKPDNPVSTVWEASRSYARAGTPLVILAGKEYGSGSSRDWAAKGPALLGVRAVIAESFERIHRSNLIGMGVLPLQYRNGQTAESLQLTGAEHFTITGLGEFEPAAGRLLTVTADQLSFEVEARLDTPQEVEYFRHGGIMPYVLRNLLPS